MSITEESSNVRPPEEESEKERAHRHAEIRLEVWCKNGGMCGVNKAFAEATLQQYDPEKTKIWRNGLRSGKWVFTYGQVGTGKTHLLSAITRSRYVWGWSCWFVNVPAFLARLKLSYDNKNEESAADLLHQAMNTELLAFDDLGTEKLTTWSSETLYLVLNERYARKMATAISSNLEVEELEKRYERISDRIRERAILVPLTKKRPERT